jgi:hypothetical protein
VKVRAGSDRSWELGGDLLGLVGDVELGDFGLVFGIVGVDAAVDHPDERRFACTVLPQHHDDFAVSEFPGFHSELEIALQSTPNFRPYTYKLTPLWTSLLVTTEAISTHLFPVSLCQGFFTVSWFK